LATESDGSCQYNPIPDATPIEKIKGCMDSSALNYNKFAVMDDGSCTYADVSKPRTFTKTFYVWSSEGGILFTDADGNKQTNVFGREYESLTITYQVIDSFSGDVREVPKIREVLTTGLYRVLNDSYYTYNPYGYNGYDSYGGTGYNGYQYYNNNGYNYNNGTSVPIFYKDSSGAPATINSLLPGQSVEICAVENTISEGPNIRVTFIGSCGGVTTPTTPSTPISGGGGGGGNTFGGGAGYDGSFGGGGGGGQFDTQSLQNFT
jgi:hypothetical protein